MLDTIELVHNALGGTHSVPNDYGSIAPAHAAYTENHAWNAYRDILVPPAWAVRTMRGNASHEPECTA